VVAKGDDPAAEKQEARKAPTVGELCDRYPTDAEAGRILGRGGLPKEASTLALDRGRITAHIKPALGRLKVASVTRADVNRMMHEIGAGQTRERQKTKPRGVSIVRPLAKAACDILRDLKQPGESDLAFPASRGDGQMDGYFKLWRRIAKPAALPADVTPHILRHSFASVAADLGYSEPTIAALAGHQGRTVTSRYTHAADAVMLAAADAVAKRIGELMGEISETGPVPQAPEPTVP
jgi:Phage integrase family